MVFKDNKTEQIKWRKKNYVYILSLIQRHACVNLPEAFTYETLCDE